jgi:uncharacterized protein involved in response to NO
MNVNNGYMAARSGRARPIYAVVVIASLVRICSSLEPAWSYSLLHIAAFAWVAAFFGFAASYGPLLVGAQRGKAAQP